ncbi:MAG: peptidyl-prolyl cis-trans isomerase [Rickettsia sp.]|nr:peptidyl-prolyl cis-trans isomerase [Rickettsia sp.]
MYILKNFVKHSFLVFFILLGLAVFANSEIIFSKPQQTSTDKISTPQLETISSKEHKKNPTLSKNPEVNKNVEKKDSNRLLATYYDRNKKLIEFRIKDLQLHLQPNDQFSQISQNGNFDLSALEKMYDDFDSNTQKTLIQSFVFGNIMTDEAQKSSLKDSQEYKKITKNVLDSILTNMYISYELMQHPDFERIMQETYDAYVSNTKKSSEWKIQFVYFEEEKHAQEFYQKISKKPEEFVSLVKNSKTVKHHSLNKGYSEESELDKKLKDILLNMSINSFSKPFKIDTGGGWLIIKLLDKRPANILSKEEKKASLTPLVQEKIMNILSQQKLEEAKLDIK